MPQLEHAEVTLKVTAQDLLDYNTTDWEDCGACINLDTPCPYHQGRIDESNIPSQPDTDTFKVAVPDVRPCPFTGSGAHSFMPLAGFIMCAQCGTMIHPN